MGQPVDQSGFDIRQRHFPDEIHFYAPGFKRYETAEFAQGNPNRFVAVSLTGTACALGCDHCQGSILQWMRAVPSSGGLYALCERLAASGTHGVLVSGGCDSRGRVPLLAFGEELRWVKERLPLQVIVHTGLVDEPTAEALAAAGVDGALIDIIGSDETIRRVYHLDATVDAFDRSLILLEEKGIPILPHIVLGLHYGQFLGEATALEIVASHHVAGLILVVLMPLVGTAMACVRPPEVSLLARFLDKARRRLPTTPVLLGCAHPGGEAKIALDRAAIDVGLNGIAFPAEGMVAYARKRGLKVQFHESCCGVGWLLPERGRHEDLALHRR